MKLSIIAIAASLLLSTASALAHDARPAYLELVETDAAVFELSWKRPVLAGRAPTMDVALPAACRNIVPRWHRTWVTLCWSAA